jgi:hypothetical protein
VFEVLFKDGPPEPLAIPQEIKDKAKREFGLNCENFYNIAVAGIAGTGKVSNYQMFRGEVNHLKINRELPRKGCEVNMTTKMSLTMPSIRDNDVRQ